MTDQDIRCLENICVRLTGASLTMQRLGVEARSAGGHDISSLSDEDIRELAQGGFSGEWSEPAFAFGEMLAFYSALPNGTGMRVVGWVFTVLILSDALDRRATDLERHLDLFLRGFLKFGPQLETAEIMHVFHRLIDGHQD